MARKIIKILLISYLIGISLLIYSCGSSKIIEKKSLKPISNLFSDTSKIEQEARYFFINGINYQVQFKDAEAIIEFQEALRYDKNASIYFSLAKSYYNIYKKDRAIENLNIALELDPNHLPSLDLISDIYYFSDLNLAIEFNERAIYIERTRERLYKNAILNENFDAKKSISIYKELLEIDDKNIMILERLANLLIVEGENDMALNILYKLNEADPSNINNFDRIIELLLENNKFEETFQFIKSKRLNLSEREFEAIIYDFGLILNAGKDVKYTTNVNNYLDYIKAEFKFNHDIMMLGAWISSKHRIELMSSFINSAIKNSDSLAKTITLCLSLYNSINDTINSINLIENHQTTVESNLDLLIASSFSYSQINKDSIALEYLKKALIMDSNNADIYSQMGFVYDKLGMIEMSDSSYINALKIDPSHPNANNNYAYSLSVRDLRLEEALKMSEKVISSKIESSAYYDTYAWINYKLGKLDLAQEYLLKAIELPDSSAEVYEHLGIVQYDLENYNGALESFKKALEIDNTRKISREKLEILKNK